MMTRPQQTASTTTRPALLWQCLAVAGALLSASSTAYAADPVNYSGVACQSSSTEIKHANGWTYNTSSVSTIPLNCPTVATEDGDTVSWIYAIDRDPFADVRCYGTSLLTGPGLPLWLGWWTAVQSTSGTNASQQEISLGGLPATDFSVYYITCDVPPKFSGRDSGILAYTVWEL